MRKTSLVAVYGQPDLLVGAARPSAPHSRSRPLDELREVPENHRQRSARFSLPFPDGALERFRLVPTRALRIWVETAATHVGTLPAKPIH